MMARLPAAILPFIFLLLLPVLVLAQAATLRYDVFNLTNRTNFGNPNADVTSASNRGTITTLAGDPRSMQFSVRLEF